MIIIGIILIVIAWRLGAAFDKRRQHPLVTYTWDGGWIKDGSTRVKNPFKPDGLPSETSEITPPPRLKAVGEGR